MQTVSRKEQRNFEKICVASVEQWKEAYYIKNSIIITYKNDDNYDIKSCLHFMATCLAPYLK